MSTKKKSNNKREREYKNLDDTLEEDEDFELLELEAKRIRASSHKIKELDTRDIITGSRERKKAFASNPQYSSHERAKIHDENLKECYDELCMLMDLPMAAPFLEPVNYVKLNIWDYAEIIKHPMDLGTIKKLLVKGVIENPDHFYLYVQLVFDNAKLYNKVDSTIHQNSIKLWNQFSEKFNSIFIPEDQEETFMIASDENIDELYEKAKALRAEIAKARESRDEVRGVMRREQPRKIRFTVPKMELTYIQKEEMCKQISDLPHDDLPGLLEIIKMADKNSANADPSGEVEIDIEKLDTQALIAIRRYIYEKNNARNAKRNLKSTANKQASASQSQKNLTINQHTMSPNSLQPSSPTGFNAALYTGSVGSYPGYYAPYYSFQSQPSSSNIVNSPSVSSAQHDPTVNSVTTATIDSASMHTASSFDQITEPNNEEIAMTDMTGSMLIDSILGSDNTDTTASSTTTTSTTTTTTSAATSTTPVDNTASVSNTAVTSEKSTPYVGMVLPLCPDESSTEGFWLGAVSSICPPDSINVQWFELKTTDNQGRRLYIKTYNTDLVPLDSAYHRMDLTNKLVHDPSSNLWVLDGISEILEKIRIEDEEHGLQ